MKQLAIGTYRLDAPLPNPQKDGRIKRDWTAEKTFPVGTYYVVAYYGGSGLAIRKAGAEGYQVIVEGSDGRFQYLAERLSPVVDEQPSDWLRRDEEGKRALNILDQLYRRGAVSKAALEAARAATEAEDYLDER